MCSFLVRVWTYPASQQQPSAVGRSVVCEAHGDAIFRQFVGVSGADNLISLDFCIGNLVRAGMHIETQRG